MINRSVAVSLVAAVGYLAGAFALKMAEKAGYLSHDMVVRSVAVFTGLGLAAYANALPKGIGLARIRNPAVAARMQSVRRVGGWGLTLGGLGYAVAALLPIPATLAILPLAIATAYVMGYFAWSVWECRAIERRPTA